MIEKIVEQFVLLFFYLFIYTQIGVFKLGTEYKIGNFYEFLPEYRNKTHVTFVILLI